jgi:hypothetical protein
MARSKSSIAASYSPFFSLVAPRLLSGLTKAGSIAIALSKSATAWS